MQIPIISGIIDGLAFQVFLGLRGMWRNWFHGGKTLASFDRTTFYSELVYSTKYIGPMKG